MITGDHAAIAKETCRQLGMGDNILLPDGLPTFDPTAEIPPTLGDDYGELIESTDGFAQVFPEHKFLIVEALRQKGYSCGMTGDGVNDAPALKKADVGIAVQGATDAARAAADLILTAPGLSVIVDAIILSRSIFQRMKNYVIYRVACTIQLLSFFFLAVLFVHPRKYNADFDESYFNLPVMALVLITILNDGTIISIAYDHVVPSPRPEKWNLKVLFSVATWLGFVAVASSMLLLHWALDSHNPNGFLQGTLGMDPLPYKQVMTLVYLKISLSDFMTVFTARTQGLFYTRAPGKLLFGAACVATGASTLLSAAWPFGETLESLSAGHVLFVWVYCVAWFLIQDLAKVAIYQVLFTFDVSGIRTEDEKCQARAQTTSPEARLTRLESEVSDIQKFMAMAKASDYKAIELASNTGM
uniref:Uncharacterized protein n=1 Tax=Prasinoderma singulare TaxID=676789 RepID=A0A7S3FK65_9VIRI